MLTFNVPNMTCGHCVQTLTQAIQTAAPDAMLECNLGDHTITVSTQTDATTLMQAINQAGYPATLQAN